MCWWEHGGWDELGWDGMGGGGEEREGGGTVLWISRIGFKNRAFVLKLQVPSEMEEKQTAKRVTVALEEQAANVPEVGTSQSKAQRFGSSWHIAYLVIQT